MACEAKKSFCQLWFVSFDSSCQWSSVFISKEENQRILILFGVSISLGLHFHPICRQVFGDAYSDSE